MCCTFEWYAASMQQYAENMQQYAAMRILYAMLLAAMQRVFTCSDKRFLFFNT